MKKINDKKISISRILRAVIFVCATAMMCLFLSEILSGYGQSLGTRAGFCASVSIMIYTMWFHSINSLILYVRRKNLLTRCIVTFCITAVLLGVAYVITATSLMISFSHRKAPASDRPPVVVVLGCRVIGDQPCTLLSERIETAYDYLVEHPESPCIVSGGQGSDEEMSEAQCMYNELVNMGISPERIYKEDRSTTTRENLMYSRDIMEKENLGDTVVLVTNSWHELRASMIASDLNLSFGTEGAPTPPWTLPSNYMRELFGIMYQFVF